MRSCAYLIAGLGIKADGGTPTHFLFHAFLGGSSDVALDIQPLQTTLSCLEIPKPCVNLGAEGVHANRCQAPCVPPSQSHLLDTSARLLSPFTLPPEAQPPPPS